MKKPVLALLALLALAPFAQLMAQTPPVAATAPVPDAAEFLATLSNERPQAPSDQVPAPLFMTGCNTHSDCPTGQLCCFLCGNPPADEDINSCKACITPVRGRCPMVV